MISGVCLRCEILVVFQLHYWQVLTTRCDRIGVSKKVTGIERARLRAIARTLQPSGFGLNVRTVAAGHSLEELHKDLDGLLATWKCIIEHAKSAALAAEEGVEGAIPVMLHKAMGQTLSVVQDYFNEKVSDSSSSLFLLDESGLSFLYYFAEFSLRYMFVGYRLVVVVLYMSVIALALGFMTLYFPG